MDAPITWVIKSSKLCNLRCTYCYEFDSLDDHSRIPESQFVAAFSKISNLSAHFGAKPKFCWHGGEPLLLPPAYYEAAFRAQREVFTQESVSNVIQTNLTALGPRQLALLKKFDHVSISLDLFGAHRVTKTGRDSQDIVLENLAHLSNEGIRVGAISVLTRENIGQVSQMFRFFNETGISFRVLPYYRAASGEQNDSHAVDYNALLGAYCELMDLWFSEGRGISVLPIDEFVRAAVIHLSGVPGAQMAYNKKLREYVYVVDTNLDVYSVADTYEASYCHGNLLTDSVEQLLHSPGRLRAIQGAEDRVESACSSCKYLGACSSWPIAEATAVERAMISGQSHCVAAAAMIARAVEWISSDPTLAHQLSPQCETHHV